MSNYTKTTNFAAKDSLPSGNAAKIVKGTEIDTEFNNIETASATKADSNNSTLTGTTAFETLSDGAISITAFVDEDNMASDSATLLPTQQSVKAYVDSQVTAQDLDFQADTGGALSIDLDSETLTFTGGTGIDTSGALNAVTFAIDSTVATLTGSQTLSNKTLSTPVVSGNLTTDGLIDGRDVATDGTKLDGIESGATADQTAAEIKTAYESNADTNAFTDADHSKLDGIEASADVTDTANVTAAGALMDSELTSEASVKAMNQGVATTDSPTFAGVTAPITGNVTGNLTGNVAGNVTGNLTGDVTGDVTGNVTGNLTGSVLTAAQTSITSVGTLGSLTVSGDVTVDTNSLKVDSTNNRVGILNASPDVTLDIGSATDSIHIPVGTTAQRPGSPAAGYFRYNSTLSQFEGYTDAWGAIGGGGGSNLVVDTMTGDGSDTTLTLSNDPLNENNTQVYIDGVYQNKDTYSVSGTTLTFSTAPPSGSAVEAMTIQPTAVNVPADASVTSAKLSGDLTLPSNLSFADNNKAIFGAGSDLQIYHDGSHSYISDQGTGQLRILASQFQIMNAAGTESMVFGAQDNTATLYYDNSAKLATTSTGIDVTGTATMDGLTVDGNTTLNTSGTLFANLNYSGSNLGKFGTDGVNLNVEATNNLFLKVNSATRAKFDGNGDISFYEDTGTTPKFHWSSSAESLGIGTSSPDTLIHLSATENAALRFEATDTTINSGQYYGRIEFEGNDAGTSAGGIRARVDALSTGQNGESALVFNTSGVGSDSDNERMRITSVGNVGIGITPATLLDIKESTAATDAIIGLTAGTGGRAQIRSEAQADNTSSELSFYTMSGSSTAERMRIDSSGSLLVGTTAVPSGGTDSIAVFKGDIGAQGTTGINTGEIGFYNTSGAKYWSIASNQTTWYFADADFSHYAFLGQNMTAWAFGSDRRLKENIVDVPYGLDAVMAMQPRAFKFKSSGVETIGFVAQELREVVPEAVTGTEVEYLDSDTAQEKANKSLGVSKDTLIPVLVKAIQEQQATIESQATAITDLTTRLTALENN